MPACPGTPLAIDIGPQTYVGTTTGAPSTVACSGGTGPGPDVVYAITAAYDGMLNIRVEPAGFDAALMTRSACPGSSEYFCRDSAGVGGAEVVDGGVTRGTRYMVIVSGAMATASGDYVITFTGR